MKANKTRLKRLESVTLSAQSGILPQVLPDETTNELIEKLRAARIECYRASEFVELCV
jgi:hypothetical protein